MTIVPSERKIVRPKHLAETIVIVDGQQGCGKTLFSLLLPTFSRVELMAYAYEVEQLSALFALGKMSEDAVVGMIRARTDLHLYNTMMSRETNFRPADLSSAWRSLHPWRYMRRLFAAGDAAVPERIARERPILHLTTHNLLATSQPVFAALGNRVVFLEIVRHPLYQLKQQTLNMERLALDVRNFKIHFAENAQVFPFFAAGWEDRYQKANPVERAIYSFEWMTRQTEAVKTEVRARYKARILTIPFERFVLDPWPMIAQMEQVLGTTRTWRTRWQLWRQHVPRRRVAEGVGYAIYRHCGWEAPSANTSEREELQKRRAFALESGASAEALAVLDQLSSEYEHQYTEGLL